MNRSTIYICLEPRADYWQLGPLTTDRGSVFLFGWRLIPPVDGGMPEAVSRVLVHAMAPLAQVTYLRSAKMKSIEDDLERLSRKNLVRRVSGQLVYRKQDKLLATLRGNAASP